jgi:AmmeMemoRadiSam system protein A/AmmeMemoRadiSam system protein B
MSIIASFMVPHPPLILPEVGRGGEKQIETTKEAYEQIAKDIADLNPETIIISSPHAPYYSDYFYVSTGHIGKGNFSNFGASEVSFEEEYDEELINEIINLSEEKNFPSGGINKETPLDHGTMVPLYFIRKKLPKTKIVVVGLSSLPLADNYEFGKIIQTAVNNLNRKVVFVASGDLSHKLQTYGPYGFAPEGPEYDEKIIKTMSNANFNELLEYDEVFLDKAAECGHRSFTIMAGALDGIAVKPEFLIHEDVTGVGYGICKFYPEGENKERCFLDKYLKEQEEIIKNQNTDAYVNLARLTIEKYIKENIIIDIPDNLPKELLDNKAGVFVSIHKLGTLRGCIGTIMPTTKCIASEIISNAISASTHDTRFNPITEDELKYLDINVDVLKEPEDITSEDELDVKKYGVIVSTEYKRGLLLPNLDGIDSVKQQIAIAKRKGNIKDDEEIKLQRFEVIRHK